MKRKELLMVAAFLLLLFLSCWLLLGCASTRVDAPLNRSNVRQVDTPDTETITLTIGGQEVQTEAK